MSRRYIYNGGRAPHITSDITLPAQSYEVIDESQGEQFRFIGSPMLVEGDPGFPELWARNYPDKTPDQLLPGV